MLKLETSAEAQSASINVDGDRVKDIVKQFQHRHSLDFIAKSLRLKSADAESIFKHILSALPPTLWLNQSRNKEGYIWYRHAWGSSNVTTAQGGGSEFPVDYVLMSVEMESPGGTERDRQQRSNSASVAVDVKYGGTIPTTPDFNANWYSEAYHPAYGKWSVGPLSW